ncbi:Glucosaminyl phosphatidylinositol (GlcN-PI) nositol acylation protein [Ascosphaera atra]|nr:Glucosaminyl phosphatidylinositol (GlcN-PI) nositol acylation protein [Ascosphaera atra]
MMIITALSILAVDFRVFPRRFAKVETWGTSLMDLGVGSFVFSGGLVSARQVLRHRTAGSNKRLLARLTSATRHALPMAVLGLVRLWSVKGLDYAEHVTEYGVHWNFFFTLSLLGPVVEVAHAAYALVPSYEALALLVAGAYQVALESTALKEFILLSPRGPGWLAKNREGVCSFVGYFAIFLAGRAAGLQVIARDSTRDPKAARRHLLLKLGGWSAVWGVLFYFNAYGAWGYGAGFAVSRRMANLPYVLWTAAFNNAQLWLFCAIETVFFPAVYQATSAEQEAEAVRFASSEVMEAYNRNGLAVFLLANLLTGAVNLGTCCGEPP